MDYLNLLAKRLFVILPWAFVLAVVGQANGWGMGFNIAGGIILAIVAYILFPTQVPQLAKEEKAYEEPRRSRLD